MQDRFWSIISIEDCIKRVDVNSEGLLLFNDGEHMLYVNGAYRGDSDIGRLMHDLNCWNPDNMHFDVLKTVTQYFKEDEKGVVIICI